MLYENIFKFKKCVYILKIKNLLFIYRWTWCHTEKDVYEMGEQALEKGKMHWLTS